MNELSIEDIEDIHTILNFVHDIGYWDYLKDNISSVTVDLDKLMNKLENIINEQ
jgi:hypothetical protein